MTQIRHCTSAVEKVTGYYAGHIYTTKGVTPEVNLGEHILCIPLPIANKAAHSGFETQRCHQKSEIGVLVAPKMDMCPPKLF